MNHPGTKIRAGYLWTGSATGGQFLTVEIKGGEMATVNDLVESHAKLKAENKALQARLVEADELLEEWKDKPDEYRLVFSYSELYELLQPENSKDQDCE